MEEKKRKVRIEIEEESSVAVVYIEEGDRVVRRRVLLPVLSHLLDASMTIETDMQYQYIEPVPNICTGLMYASQDTFRIAFDVPAAVRPFVFINGSSEVRFDRMPFPRCAFVFDIQKGTLKDSFCCAVNQKNERCVFPFPNVHDSCSICWGENRIGQIDSISKVTSCIRLFFESGFNTHLYYGYQNVNIADDPSIEELLRRLKDKDVFPDEWLNSANESVEVFFDEHLKKKG